MSRATITGHLPAELGNAVSDAIHFALTRGMETDEAVAVVLKVAADYGRMTYGADYLQTLSKLILEFKDAPEPQNIAGGRP